LQHLLENSRTVAAVFRGGYIPKVIDFRTKLGMESMEIPGVGAMLGPHQGDGLVDLGSNPWIETCPKVCGAAVFGCCW